MRTAHRAWGRAAVVAACVVALQGVGHADEGFWLFNRIPRAAIKQAYGVDLTDAWVERVQQASVRFPSGSGSFVSADGLVLTNHHVAMDIIQELSTPIADYVTTGFVARDRAQEIKAPEPRAGDAAVDRGRHGAGQRRRSSRRCRRPKPWRRAAPPSPRSRKRRRGRPGLQSEMVTLYQGAQYHLYLYKKFTDVRLVFAPEFDVAFFGGDPDNFNFPRYCLDMSLFRVYENGKPLQVKNYLPWSAAGAKEGEPVFTSGHPGATQRLNTVAHLEFLRDQSLPFNLDVYGRIRDALERVRQAGRRAGAPGARICSSASRTRSSRGRASWRA